MNTRLKGAMGEQEAARFLRSQGYTILAANYRTRVGEIDIIACKDGYICFVEVKSRKEGGYLPPKDAVGYDKENRIFGSAEIYLSYNKTNLIPRYDIIEVYTENGKAVRLNHIENAFY